MGEAYDPLNYENLARSVVSALLQDAPSPLPPESPFEGSGVYAIYYCGSLPFYSRIASRDCRVPIYVGKAVPTGARKGSLGAELSAGQELCRRLREHAESIQQAKNLRLAEFKCRYLVVVPVWITLAERFLVDRFRPIWNTRIDGFGNHDPGAGRKGMRKPRWDIVHPGRPWAEKLAAASSPEEVLALIADEKRSAEQP